MADMKPILFSTEMVKALLEGRKTMTRRLIKPQPSENAEMRYVIAGEGWGKWQDWSNRVIDAPKWTPPYHADDILYVRETWRKRNHWGDISKGTYGVEIEYKAGGPTLILDHNASAAFLDTPSKPWRPSIHMPKEAARIFLRVKSVRVERLKEISASDAMAEGFTDWNEFVTLWDSTIPKHPNKFKSYPYYWKDNPWVWVIEFERISKEEALK